MRFTTHGKFFLLFAGITAISFYYSGGTSVGSYLLKGIGGLAAYFTAATVVMALFSLGRRDDEEEEKGPATEDCAGC